jgi:hypothetical protein
MRSATIRWSQLPTYCENGPETGYEVTMLDSQKNAMYVVTLGLTKKKEICFYHFFLIFSLFDCYVCSESKNVSSVDMTQTVFNNLNKDKGYGFILQSYNSVGYSPTSSQVFLPMSANSM